MLKQNSGNFETHEHNKTKQEIAECIEKFQIAVSFWKYQIETRTKRIQMEAKLLVVCEGIHKKKP